MSDQPFGSPDEASQPTDPNPYAPTTNTNADVEGDVEACRRFYLSHEASVRSIGTLYILGAVILVPMGGLLTVGALVGTDSSDPRAVMVIAGLIYLGLGLLQGFTGAGLWRLRPWARIVAIIIAAVGLLGFPLGTIISVYFLWLLAGKKGQFVFSEKYRHVIEQTPHIKYRTSVLVWLLLLILITVIAIAVIAPLAFGN